MDDGRIERRLAAILAADVVGYSRLIEADESGTRARLRALLSEVVAPGIAADRGRLVKTLGDGLLVEFASAVDAVRHALWLQERLADYNAALPEAERLLFRIGVNLGDIIVEGEDIHGDGVNLASRIEALCEPGAVMVSSSVYDQVVGKLDAAFADLGERRVKNISRPLRLFAVTAGGGAAEGAARAAPGAGEAEAAGLPDLPAQPSIAVMPFKCPGGDAEQQDFADGLRLAIQATLVRVPGLFLLAPPAVAGFRGRDVPAAEAAQELAVRYVLEGMAQRSGERLRVTVQLTDALEGKVVWAERFNRAAGEVLEVQDEITVAVVSTLDLTLASSESLRNLRGSLTSLEALDAFYHGLNYFYNRNETNIQIAMKDFEALYRLQPDSPLGPALLAMCYMFQATMGWCASKEKAMEEAVAWAEKTVDFEGSNGMGHITLAVGHLLGRRHEEALQMAYKALELRPTCPLSTVTLANVLHYSGHSAEAIPKARGAMRLIRAYPPWFVTLLAAAYRDIDDLDQAIATARQGLERAPQDVELLAVLCSAYRLAGLEDKAAATARQMLEIDPGFSRARYGTTQPYRDEARLRLLLGTLGEAGLPA